MSEPRTVLRFRRPTVIYHWLNTIAFVGLLVTGAILLFPGTGIAASGGITRMIHRIMMVIYVVPPIIYTIRYPHTAIHFVQETLTWGKDDLGWLMAAPDYYFGGDPCKMPLQDHINTGQKAWQLVVLGTAVLFVISGFVMMFLQGIAPAWLYSVSLMVHDFAFFVAFIFLLVHIYLGSVHPCMNESLRSMIDGKISPDYAQHHYGKWYERCFGSKDQS